MLAAVSGQGRYGIAVIFGSDHANEDRDVGIPYQVIMECFGHDLLLQLWVSHLLRLRGHQFHGVHAYHLDRQLICHV